MNLLGAVVMSIVLALSLVCDGYRIVHAEGWPGVSVVKGFANLAKEDSANPCNEKMRDAMRAMDMIVQGNSGFLIYKWPTYPEHNPVIVTPDDQMKQQWNAVMNQCVRGMK